MSVRITGNVCAYLVSFVRGKGTNPKGIGGRAGVRLVISITPAVLSPAYRFLLVQFKNEQIMYRRKFNNLNRKLALKKEKALEAARKSQIEFYVELTKELYKSNKLDCSRESDKCRRKRVSYMANKLRQ